MTTLLNNLQQKSDQQKALLATFTAVIITGFLFIAWGYNFAHSGKINNLASSAVGVAGVVEVAKLSETFNDALEQLKSISGLAETEVVGEQVAEILPDSVGAKYINVFNNTSTEKSQEYGENSGDVLY